MIVLNKGLDGFLHGLIPRRLREDLKPNTAVYIRVRALTVMLVVVNALATLAVLTIGGVHLLVAPALLKYDAVIFIALVLLSLQTWLFYHFNNHWVSGIAFTNFYLLIIITVLLLSGGYEFNGKTVLLTCPMISFLIGGRQEGIQNACISVVFFFALAFLYSFGFRLPDIFGNPHLIFSVNWIFSIALIAVTLVVYESELKNRSTRSRVRQNPPRHLSNERGWSEHGIGEMIRRLNAHLHTLLPSELRESLDSHSMVYVRTRILITLLLVATVISFLTVALLLGIDLFFHLAQFRYDILLVVVPLCLGLQTWLFYKLRNPQLSGLLLGYFTSLAIVAVVLLTGGYDSPVLVLMAICPIGFFMITGVRDGVTNSILIAITGTALSYLHYIGLEFTDFFHDQARPVTAGIAWFIAITVIMVCMMTYDTELEKL